MCLSLMLDTHPISIGIINKPSLQAHWTKKLCVPASTSMLAKNQAWLEVQCPSVKLPELSGL